MYGFPPLDVIVAGLSKFPTEQKQENSNRYFHFSKHWKCEYVEWSVTFGTNGLSINTWSFEPFLCVVNLPQLKVEFYGWQQFSSMIPHSLKLKFNQETLPQFEVFRIPISTSLATHRTADRWRALRESGKLRSDYRAQPRGSPWRSRSRRTAPTRLSSAWRCSCLLANLWNCNHKSS